MGRFLLGPGFSRIIEDSILTSAFLYINNGCLVRSAFMDISQLMDVGEHKEKKKNDQSCHLSCLGIDFYGLSLALCPMGSRCGANSVYGLSYGSTLS